MPATSTAAEQHCNSIRSLLTVKDRKSLLENPSPSTEQAPAAAGAARAKSPSPPPPRLDALPPPAPSVPLPPSVPPAPPELPASAYLQQLMQGITAPQLQAAAAAVAAQQVRHVRLESLDTD